MPQEQDVEGYVYGTVNAAEQPDGDNAVHHYEPGPALMLSEDLQQLLRAYGGARARSNRPSKPYRRRRQRTRALPVVPPPARRRRGAGGAHAENAGVSSDSSSADFASDPAADGDGGGADIDDGDAPADLWPHILAAVQYYEGHIIRELGAALGVPVLGAAAPSQLCSVAVVGNGGAAIIVEGEKAYAVWLALPRETLLALCSCCGRRGAESVEVREMLDLSSYCVHARALLTSIDKSAERAGLPGARPLLQRFPFLDNSRTGHSAARVVHYASHTKRKRGAFAVLYDGIWSAVVIRERLAKAKTKSRRLIRPSCLQLSCAKDHRWCLHAKAVWDWCVAALRSEDGPTWPAAVPTNVRLVDAASHVPQQPPSAAERLADEARFCNEVRWRAARNFLPCSGELDDCAVFDDLANVGRVTGQVEFLDTVLDEDVCFKCGGAYSGASVKNTGATLHTLRGRLSVRLQQWLCPCGEPVPYDGAQDGLFASSMRTVFTRTFMDMMQQMVFNGHSTMTSATGVACSLLEVTQSLSGASSGLARQTLIKAIHRFSRALLVPSVLFHCPRCYLNPHRPYRALIPDGEVLSVQRNQSEPLEKDDQDVPVVAMDVGLGACLPSPGTGAVIRKRTCHAYGEAMRLSSAEHSSLVVLHGAAAGDPDPHNLGPVVTHPANVSWACAYTFILFYCIENGAVQAPAAADGGGGGGAPNGDALVVGPDPAPVADGGELGQGAPDAAGDGPPAAAVGAPAAAGQPGIFPCAERADAVPDAGDVAVMRERRRVVQRFLHTFLAEPVVGAFAGLNRPQIRLLAVAMVRAVPGRAWIRSAKAVESVGVVWPFVRFIADAPVMSMPLVRAGGEVLLFACGVDAYWETMWRRRASPAALNFETQWKETSVAKFREWRLANPVLRRGR